MKTVGLCRFSYPCLGRFQITHDSIEDRIAYLYGKERMEERFRFFETLTLPSIANQTDDDFTLVILIGEQLPDIYRERLLAAVAHHANIVVVQRPPLAYKTAMESVFSEIIGEHRGPTAQFRLDDDDAVGKDFIRLSKAYFRDGSAVFERERRLAIDFHQGWVLGLTPGGATVQKVSKPLWAPGLMCFLYGDAPKTVMHFPHHLIAKHMIVHSHREANMFIRGASATSDSQLPKRLLPKEKISEHQRRLFQKAFGVTL